MFTGIINHIGKVTSKTLLDAGVRVGIETQFKEIVEGESISVEGVCLTAIHSTPRTDSDEISERPSLLEVDISPETLARSTLASLEVGSHVNLERALGMGDALGGHWVTGHVDCTAEVKEARQQGPFLWVIFGGLPPSAARWLIQKGSVAINGVSLTVNEVYTDGFSVMLIPHTLEKTDLKTLEKSSKVNIEFDWMIKTVIRDLNQRITWIEEANAEFRSH